METVRIERIAAGGDGVGRLGDGRVVFVPRTAPGDLVECRLTRAKARFARARIHRVVDPGPGRIEPPCRHYREDDCGGCQLQHLAADHQRAARSAVVGDAIRRIARIPADDPVLAPAPADWGYRAKITLAADRDGRLGYHRYDRPEQIFTVDRCPIAAEGLSDLVGRFRAARRLWPDLLERVVFRLDRGGAEHLIVATGAGPIWNGGPALRREVAGAAPLTVWWQPEAGAARAVAGSDSAYPATAFEQIHPAMGDQVRTAAVASLGTVAGKVVWDLYAGIGETSTALAERGATVQSVERDRGAVAEAERRQAGFGRRIDRVVGSAEAVVRSLLQPDLVVVNPPRIGLERAVAEELGRRKPGRIVYVSCDPATLARDLARLTGQGYRLASLAAFDLFPQTAHVESVAVVELA